jgi:hypothetical protein
VWPVVSAYFVVRGTLGRGWFGPLAA